MAAPLSFRVECSSTTRGMIFNVSTRKPSTLIYKEAIMNAQRRYASPNNEEPNDPSDLILVQRFRWHVGRKTKLLPKFREQYEVLDRVGSATYVVNRSLGFRNGNVRTFTASLVYTKPSKPSVSRDVPGAAPKFRTPHSGFSVTQSRMKPNKMM